MNKHNRAPMEFYQSRVKKAEWGLEGHETVHPGNMSGRRILQKEESGSLKIRQMFVCSSPEMPRKPQAY